MYIQEVPLDAPGAAIRSTFLETSENFLHISKTKTFPSIKFCKKIALSYLEIIVKGQIFKYADRSFWNGLSGPQGFREFRETFRTMSILVPNALCVFKPAGPSQKQRNNVKRLSALVLLDKLVKERSLLE